MDDLSRTTDAAALCRRLAIRVRDDDCGRSQGAEGHHRDDTPHFVLERA
jgi:hypothetical protein